MKKLFTVMVLVIGMLVVTSPNCQGANNVFYGCYQKNNGQLRIVEKPSECRASEIPISWNQVGPQGPRGLQGPQGPEGPSGVPSGFFILGDSPTTPDGYTYTGVNINVGGDGGWTTKASMPTARRGSVAAGLNNKIYVIGGNNTQYYGSFLSVNEMYDPSKDTWTTKASMPTIRDFPGAATGSSQ
jgi:hypothetical protein